MIDSTGDFSAVFSSNERIIFTNDFFGIQKIYFYICGGLFFASNRVHLLLIAMAASDINLKMDKEHVLANLVSGYVQPFQQIFSHDLMVDGVKLLPIDKRIVFENGSVYFELKLISDLLANNLSPLRDQKFDELLDKGCKDILTQCAAVLKHPKFKHVVFDSTVGMDSRVIIAAAANFESIREKIVLNAMDTPSIPLDIRVGCTLSESIGFRLDDLPETVELRDSTEHKLGLLSKMLGSYFAHDLDSLDTEKITRIDAINVTGFFGEICLRPYYSRSFIDNNDLNTDTKCDEGNFFNFILSDNRSMLTHCDGLKLLKKLWIAANNSLPWSSDYEKYDLHYLFFRNGLHCSDMIRVKWNTPRVGIIQSPKLFLLKRKLYRRISSTFLQNSVIEKLEPKLLDIPYASDRDNEGLKIFHEIKIPAATIERKQVAENGLAAIQARERKKRVHQPYSVEIRGRVDFRKLAKIATLALFKSEDLIDRDLAYELIMNLNSKTFSHVLANKILMVYYMVKLTKAHPGEAFSSLGEL